MKVTDIKEICTPYDVLIVCWVNHF